MLTAASSANDVPLQAKAQTMANTTTTRRIVLTGFMGAGKSTVGRALAERLGWEFFDVDAMLEEKHACTIADLFVQHEEAGFRRLESGAIARALAKKNAVIALGGGAIEGLGNRLQLEQTPGTLVVFLDAPFGELFDRCMMQPNAAVRPVLADPAAAEARFLQRLPLYRRAAGLIVQTAGHAPQQTVEAIVTQVLKPGEVSA